MKTNEGSFKSCQCRRGDHSACSSLKCRCYCHPGLKFSKILLPKKVKREEYGTARRVDVRSLGT